MMRLRIDYAKTTAMRYTSNLDVHKSWERTLRRARLPLAYSQGFHPQPRIHQASPLPLGLISQAEVIDVRTLVPLDTATLVESVAKTNRVLIAHEAHERSGPGAEIAAVLASEAVEYLDGPIVRVAAKNVPIPYSPVLENYVLPSTEDIVSAALSFWPSR